MTKFLDALKNSVVVKVDFGACTRYEPVGCITNGLRVCQKNTKYKKYFFEDWMSLYGISKASS